MLSSLALGLNETSSLASTHARNTLQALGKIYDPSDGATCELIETIIVIEAYWLLSNHYEICSLVFLHMIENAWDQLRRGVTFVPCISYVSSEKPGSMRPALQVEHQARDFKVMRSWSAWRHKFDVVPPVDRPCF
jgi:hypothetical protein